MNTEYTQLDHEYEAFVRLLSKHDSATRAYVRNCIRSWDDVNDVMQEISIVAWRKFSELDDVNRFGQWLSLIARYEILAYKRRKARDRHVLSDDLISLVLSEELISANAFSIKQEAMQECLNHLSPARRELLMKMYGSEKNLCLVAEQTGKSIDALYQIVSRLRRMLNDCLHKKLSAEGVS
jgi:RNA polymerase sigma-70 factor (ECF subfamily)